MLKFLMDNWFTVATTGFSLFSAYYFYRAAKPLRRLSYVVRSTVLISKQQDVSPHQLTIMFNGRQIENLKKFNLIVWNSGREAIHKDDVLTSKPFSVTFAKNNFCLLRTQIIKKSRDHNTMGFYESRGQHFSLHFLNLEPGEGFNVEGIFTGEEQTVRPEIAVSNMSLGLDAGFDHDDEDKRPADNAFVNLGLFLFVMFLVVGYRLLPHSYQESLKPFFLSAGSVLIIFAIVLNLRQVFRRSRLRVPRNLI